MDNPRGGEININPWKRPEVPGYQYTAEDGHYFRDYAQKRPKFEHHMSNAFLDFNTKEAALKASQSIVALECYSGNKEMSQGCGTIVEVNEDNMAVVLTSCNLIRRPTEAYMGENALANDLKVLVHGADEKSYEGKIYAYDFHYNLLAIIFKPDSSLPAAKLRPVDDSHSLQLVEEKSYTLRPHSVKLEAGDTVVALGRYFTKPFEFMVAPGCFCLDRTENDCKELCLTTCNITRCGDGGPVINTHGEVIGVIFYDKFSPRSFLPINLVWKWWEHYKSHGESRHLYLGFEATNLYVARIALLERVIKRFPTISKGVIVEKVIPGSFAESAGLQQNDIIVKCNGMTVDCFLKLWEALWNNVGGVVELEVARVECSSFIRLHMMVGETTPDQLNSWPRREYR